MTEAVDDTRQVTFQSHANLTGLGHQFQLTLEEFDDTGEKLCKDLGVKTKAFTLKMSKAGQPAIEVYRDTSSPKSRGCVLPNRYVVLVRFFTYAFEGPDARYIALPVTAPLRVE